MPQKPHRDQKYIEALLKNDKLLIKEIYDKWHKNALIFVTKNSGNEQDADDVFQETLTALLLKARKDNFILTVPLGGFLFFIYRARWIDILKKRGVEKKHIKEFNLYLDNKDSIKIAEELIFGYKKQMLFDFCFQKLSGKCKKILEMKIAKIPAKEIMVQLDIANENAVHQNVSRCKAKMIDLRKKYESDFFD